MCKNSNAFLTVFSCMDIMHFNHIRPHLALISPYHTYSFPRYAPLYLNKSYPPALHSPSSSALCMRDNMPYFPFLVLLLMLISSSTNCVLSFFFMANSNLTVYTDPIFLYSLISFWSSYIFLGTCADFTIHCSG